MNYAQKERLIDRLCGTGLMLIFIEIIFGVVQSSYNDFNYNYHDVNTWIFIGGGVLLAVAIGLLIYSYIKKSGSKALYGIELLVMAFSVALLPGCYIYFSRPFNELRRVFPFIFLIYYIGKAVYIIMHRNDVQKNTKKKKR